MQRVKTLTLTAGGQDVLERGRLNLDKGKAMRGIRLKATFPVVKSDAGTTTLSSAMKLALLNALIISVRYGRNLRRAPLNNVLGGMIRFLARYLLGTEVEGYSDATYGFGKTIAASSTTNVTVYLVIPTGWFWQLMLGGLPAGFFGVGRSQAKTLQLDVRRQASDPLTPLGATLSVGTVTIDVMPDVVSCKGDRWTVLPELVDTTVTDIEKTFDDGLPLLLVEKTAVHASSTFTELEVSIDEEPIHAQVTPQDVLTEWNDQPKGLVSSEYDISDTYTLLYWVAVDKKMKDLPSGQLKFRQPRKDLASMSLAYLFVPVVRESELREEVEDVASVIRKKTVRGVSSAQLSPGIFESRQQFAAPFVHFDEDDSEFERYPGLVAVPGGKADVYIPNSILASARSAVAQAKGNGEQLKAAQIAQQVALAVPGSVQSGRGFSKVGSVAAAAIASKLA
jgi:hypothetical protein